MSFDNNSFYDDNSTKNWQPQPTPMEDRRRRHTGKWVTAILILGLLNRSDTGFLLTVGTQPAQTAPTEQTQTAKETEPSVQTEAPAQTQQAAEELPQLTITRSSAGVPTVASDEDGALSLQEIYRRCIGSVVSIVTVTPSGKASGTGIIMSEDGYVITNHHVIESAQAVSVLTADSQEYTASVVGSDETSDLAVLKIEAEGLQAAEFGDSSVLQVGDSVAAIGDPLGTALRGTMTDGIVSAINRDLTVNDRTMSLIQTNAALNNGNSGGPLINVYGQVVGINTMKMGSSSTTSVEGLGFAIPIASTAYMINDLIAYGEVHGEVVIGISVQIAPVILDSGETALRVMDVTPGGPGEEAGIQKGDLIVTADGEALTKSTDLLRVRRRHEAGETLKLLVERDGKRFTADVVLRESDT